MVSYKTYLFYTQTQGFFVIPVYIFNGKKQQLVDMIGILSVLHMSGLHDKRHLLAKLRICITEICQSIEFFQIFIQTNPIEDDLILLYNTHFP